MESTVAREKLDACNWFFFYHICTHWPFGHWLVTTMDGQTTNKCRCHSSHVQIETIKMVYAYRVSAVLWRTLACVCAVTQWPMPGQLNHGIWWIEWYMRATVKCSHTEHTHTHSAHRTIIWLFTFGWITVALLYATLSRNMCWTYIACIKRAVCVCVCAYAYGTWRVCCVVRTWTGILLTWMTQLSVRWRFMGDACEGVIKIYTYIGLSWLVNSSAYGKTVTKWHERTAQGFCRAASNKKWSLLSVSLETRICRITGDWQMQSMASVCLLCVTNTKFPRDFPVRLMKTKKSISGRTRVPATIFSILCIHSPFAIRE